MNPNAITINTPPIASPWQQTTLKNILDDLFGFGDVRPDFATHRVGIDDPFANGWNAAMKYMKDHPAPVSAPPMPTPINVIFNNPATIVYWSDGTKTVVKCQPGDTFSAETGLTTAMLKKYMGNDNTFNRVINYWLKRTGNYNQALSAPKIPALPDATPPAE